MSQLTIISWRPHAKGALRGFCDVQLPNTLTIRDITVHAKDGRAWINLPGKPELDPTGAQKRDQYGKALYKRVIEWPDKETANRFSQAVIQAIEQEHGIIITD